MQIFHDLLQVFLGFLFSGHVRETDSLRGFDIHFGVAFAHPEHHGIGTAHLIHHPFGQHPVDSKKDDHGKDPVQHKGHNRRCLLYDLALKGNAVLMQAVYQTGVLYGAGLIIIAFLVFEQNLIAGNLDFRDLLLFCHGNEGIVIHLLDADRTEHGLHKHIKEQDNGNDGNPVNH